MDNLPSCFQEAESQTDTAILKQATVTGYRNAYVPLLRLHMLNMNVIFDSTLISFFRNNHIVEETARPMSDLGGGKIVACIL